MEKTEGLQRDNISIIYPIVVVLERGMTVPWMAEYLNQSLRAAMPTRVRGKTITRLYVVDIENLERLIPFMEHVPLSEMLDSYFDAHVRRVRHIQRAVKPENIPVLSNVTASEDIVSTDSGSSGVEWRNTCSGWTRTLKLAILNLM